jgi:hypothetical protein
VGEIIKRPLALNSRDLAVDGRKVMDLLGLEEGPEVGRVLDHLIERVMDEPELNTIEGLTALLNEMGSS